MVTEEARRLHDEALRLKPEGAEHDVAQCPFCHTDAASGIPPTPGRSDEQNQNEQPDLATEGGKTAQMADDKNTISQETHEALLTAAVNKATADLAARVSDLEGQVTSLTQERDEAQASVATLESENERLNSELDTAQVQVKTLTDEKAALETEITKRDEDTRLAEIASQRAEQVRNLDLLPADVVKDRASKWASLSDEDWAERLDEMKAAKGASGTSASTTTADNASAMSGSSESQDKADEDAPVSARKAVLSFR